MALVARFRVWRDRRRIRRHEQRDKGLIALTHEHLQDHGKKSATDIDKSLWDHYDDIYGEGAGRRWAEDEFRHPSN